MDHLQELEAEAIFIMREVAAECEKPVMLYSIGKDSSVMLHTNSSSSNRNTSSMVIPKNFAILCARKIEGLYRPVSRELMVCRDTPRALANSS